MVSSGSPEHNTGVQTSIRLTIQYRAVDLAARKPLKSTPNSNSILDWNAGGLQQNLGISQFTFFRKYTLLKPLRLLGVSIFFDGDFEKRSET